MDSLKQNNQMLLHHLLPPKLINPFLSHNLKPIKLITSPFKSHFLCSISKHLKNPNELILQPSTRKPTKLLKPNVETLKKNWLSSLSHSSSLEEIVERNNGGSSWVIGVDPDVSGALAVLKPDGLGFIAEVFDSPIVQVSVGKTTRRRLDARSIIQLLQNIDAPQGITAYIEQSIPFPQDGKLGWWSSGFGYGLWIGVLVASGYSVVPVPSSVWKKEFQLAGSGTSKDDSRELAAKLFPNLSPMLKRKKDHGRAEALLIAAYGKGINPKSDEPCVSNTIVKL